jgi:hypothetical protein
VKLRVNCIMHISYYDMNHDYDRKIFIRPCHNNSAEESIDFYHTDYFVIFLELM